MRFVEEILEALKWAVIDTTVLAIPFCIFMRRSYLKEKKTDEFIKRHYRL